MSFEERRTTLRHGNSDGSFQTSGSVATVGVKGTVAAVKHFRLRLI